MSRLTINSKLFTINGIGTKFNGISSTDNEGAITAITRTTTSAGAIGTTATNLSAYTQLSYASDSPIQGSGNYWMNTFNQTVSNGLTDGTTYYYQLWVKGNVETPTTSNEQWSMIPMQVQK